MRALRIVAAALAIVSSGWLLMAANGLRIIARDHAAGWQIYDLPSHPVVRMVGYLTVGLALPFFAAWLMPISGIAGATARSYERRYLGRVFIAFVGAFLIACALAFIAMALLDAG
jgi:hypothetical protein